MNKRKILSLAMALSIVAIMAVGATLAYFTDVDNASNTFELGGVDIDLIERKYVDGKWEEIVTPEASANPVNNLGQLDPGVVEYYNKCVFTINNEDDAYIRNYVALEDTTGEDIYKIWFNNAGIDNPSEAPDGDYRHGAVITEKFDDIEIDGNKYDIYVFDTIGNAIVEKGDSFQSLTTVTLDATVTNETVAQLGDVYEVYTFSEAIQAAGLSHADAMSALIGDDGDLEAHATRLISGMVNPQ